MAPKGRRTEIEALKKMLKKEPSDDEHSGDEQTPQPSRSLEIIDVRPDLYVVIP